MRAEPLSRRQFLVGSPVSRHARIPPPGASAEGLEACTGCGLCAERCPTGIIRLVDALPSIDFELGECTFCGACKSACPEPVFQPEPAKRFAHVAVVTEGCLAKKDVACQSCGESCPEHAIRFRPRIGGPFLPELREEMCSGCGACLKICPVAAIALRARDMEAVDA
ncbi:ferredoxin-type protein NapF [Rhizobium mongolense]|uniref:Ferredoxin-type protein NapF n=1 Tax=Rhizobium mongolense TaxID=57676 RepID=A0A7W6RV56_9HYPH|nr:ferredoxin-type protein NapF [Rhizobium mongolense]MBB4279222.1 ferredoxin-type protein NapF [Rhizobium mongolense]